MVAARQRGGELDFASAETHYWAGPVGAYRLDADLKALSSEREAAITKTKVLIGHEHPTYAT